MRKLVFSGVVAFSMKMNRSSENKKLYVQSEVSQKEKNKYRILMHICGIQKNGIDDLTCKAEIDTDVENKCMDTKG